MRGHVFLVLLLVVSVLAPLPANAQGRAMDVETTWMFGPSMLPNATIEISTG